MTESKSPPERSEERFGTTKIPGPAHPRSPWRSKVHELIFEADTPAGRAFDVTLWICIMASVTAVILESVTSIREAHGPALRAIEWGFTLLFTIEYALRLASVGRPWRYALSFYGVVDLLAIMPTYLSLVITGTQSLLVIRALRLLRIFRVLKLGRFVGAERLLRTAVRASVRKIIVFLGAVLTLMLIIGALMYLIEGEENGFHNIPQSIYWAIVTMTTVGYGDIAPQTVLGKFFASTVMILGYGIIAVPTGIVTVELANAGRKGISTQCCPQCAAEGHDTDANFCKYCGARL
ncbi:MAG: ion transporter [bacterium]|nr:ion transporter [bacterium]